MVRTRTDLKASFSVLCGAALTIAMAASALGYAGETPTNATLSTEGDIQPGIPIPLSATVLGPSGTGVPDVTVTFTITDAPPGADDVLSPRATSQIEGVTATTVLFIPDQPTEPIGVFAVGSTASDVTDADGAATVSLILDAVVGSRTITASANGEVLGSITIVLEPDSLPNTAVSVPAAPANPVPVALVLIGGVAAAFGLRRLTRSHREEQS
ncbi:MAG: hypothetical protein ACRDGB_07405 [Candidatus Limnocylindria bacterium]